MAILLTLVVWCTSGCAHTLVPATSAIQPSALAQRMLPSLPVHVSSTVGSHYIAGTQFGFIFLPLGRVAVADPQSFLRTAVYEQSLQHGMIAVPDATATLSFDLQKLSITVWDLLATRRVVIKLKIQMKRQGQGMSHTEHCAAYQPYPFGEVLQHELQKCVHLALAKLWL